MYELGTEAEAQMFFRLRKEIAAGVRVGRNATKAEFETFMRSERQKNG
jgi:hypothetical protein